MVSPSRRRRAVAMLQERLGLSQRRACRIVGQHRSTQRYQPADADPDSDLRERLRRFARAHPRWGYRRAHAVLVREGLVVNRKKIQRLWREEGLRVPAKRSKRRRLGESVAPATRLRAERPDHVWALDYQFDVTAAGRTIKILHVVDEFTRESLADLVAYSIDADATVACLDKIAAVRGFPQFIRCDNGPELTAAALRDWCRFTSTRTSYIEPGSPWQNPWVESYGGRMRDELLAVEQFDTLLGSPGPCRRLARGIQQLPSPFRPGHAHPSRVRPAMEEPTPTAALITGGPPNGVRSDFVRTAYERRPAENGVTLTVCARCGVPLFQARGSRNQSCGTPNCDTSPKILHLPTLGFYWVLHRGARRFVHDPGVFELRVCEKKYVHWGWSRSCGWARTSPTRWTCPSASHEGSGASCGARTRRTGPARFFWPGRSGGLSSPNVIGVFSWCRSTARRSPAT
ncbi:hypothetical protein GCM10020256_39710 [Streptomyces thermocoprophilus]